MSQTFDKKNIEIIFNSDKYDIIKKEKIENKDNIKEEKIIVKNKNIQNIQITNFIPLCDLPVEELVQYLHR
jgi:hypothetical protein